MNLKDFRSRLRDDEEPQLARAYRNEMAAVYNCHVHVSKDSYAQFRVFEDELKSRGYSATDYATTVAKFLMRWVMDRKLRCVPKRVFLGDWALGKYVRVSKREYVDISNTDDDRDTLVLDELTVARVYVHRNVENGTVCRIMDIVAELRPMLSDDWLQLYDGGMRRPVTEALDTLCEEFGVYASSYVDIVRKLKERK